MTSILHLAHAEDWTAALTDPAGYRVSTRGATLEQIGFIHGSTAAQLPIVAEAFYADDPAELLVLVVDLEAVSAAGTKVKWEDGGQGEHYPHLYGPLYPNQVLAALPAGFKDGRFQLPELSGHNVLEFPPED
ncbi:uncharacterized protein (DUF952 family) [Psychromicrobium silvestre]|uniref:Uncharacterized protein (DUF952 family) n=1 Tax=Psychromicrobium silvestre TaxID=1645614 RepID=A0A7Y9LTQ9_9MICC|nr:DUF952 domain-containing protein [Psychromicrobium silvestre]NYE95385.1 uncharacterized protein (DUF952 family) [Psychromicrobium silvestre]NYE95401.1 uncharacterized protein (DUF952 family) [Psychromicrobium silvestre]